jgi:hypothetical protein
MRIHYFRYILVKIQVLCVGVKQCSALVNSFVHLLDFRANAIRPYK